VFEKCDGENLHSREPNLPTPQSPPNTLQACHNKTAFIPAALTVSPAITMAGFITLLFPPSADSTFLVFEFFFAPAPEFLYHFFYCEHQEEYAMSLLTQNRLFYGEMKRWRTKRKQDYAPDSI
jgi:hypothetical protein